MISKTRNRKIMFPNFRNVFSYVALYCVICQLYNKYLYITFKQYLMKQEMYYTNFFVRSPNNLVISLSLSVSIEIPNLYRTYTGNCRHDGEKGRPIVLFVVSACTQYFYKFKRVEGRLTFPRTYLTVKFLVARHKHEGNV